MDIRTLAAAPLAWPAACVALACACETSCPTSGVAACVGIAALGAASLFLVLAFVSELASLGALRD
jgi:hypothetical protein